MVVDLDFFYFGSYNFLNRVMVYHLVQSWHRFLISCQALFALRASFFLVRIHAVLGLLNLLLYLEGFIIICYLSGDSDIKSKNMAHTADFFF